MAIVEIQHLSKTFGDRTVLKDIDFSVEAGEVVTIIGSSGSGTKRWGNYLPRREYLGR